MNVLAIDCSTSRGSVALLCGGALRFSEEFLAERSHTATLFGCLERARELVDRPDIVAVGLGPGSYAGTRIAISAAIGFQLGLGSKLVGIPSVSALETDHAEYIAVGDARRDSYYFTRVQAGCCLQGPLLADELALHALLDAHPRLPVFAGEPLNAFPRAVTALPVASRIALLAAAGTGVVQQDGLQPIYLREPHITVPRGGGGATVR